MSLKAFEFAKVEESWLLELARGYIVALDLPIFSHSMQINAIRTELSVYDVAHPNRIHVVAGPMDCKLLIPKWESERHPDIAVYLRPPIGKKDRTLWRRWFPEFVIEVVSEGSRDRDYTQKRDEYWTLGVKEYWIVDAELQQVMVLRRGKSDWIEKILGPADTCETKLLPGFKLPCGAIFDAAGGADNEA
jgi:Uma2 family endonuclease